MHNNKSCRICKGRALHKFLSLGPMPLANAFLTKDQLKEEEPFFPLDVYFCGDCSLVQLVDVVSPKTLFKNYVYVSSTSQSFVAHFQSLAQDAVQRFRLDSSSLVVDIGSNDGILLRPFKDFSVRVVGIEPADNIAALANKSGIETLPVFFNKKAVSEIVRSHGKANLVTATNVFAHVDDIDHFVESVKELLAEDGVFLVEVPYLRDFVQKNLFDTIYHEHLSYYSLKPLAFLFRKHRLEIFDVQKTSSHGGSVRLFVKKVESGYPVSASVAQCLEEETKLRLYSLDIYQQFAQNVVQMKGALLDVLHTLKSSGKKIVGFGAPAKGNTLLNYFGINNKILDHIVDDSVFKQNLYTPGTHIPVVSPQVLENDPPDYILILAWNFADVIMKKLDFFRSRGGKFILPIPKAQIV